MRGDDWSGETGDPPFRDTGWLRGHCFDLLDFYYPACIDHEHGGYIAQVSDVDGSVYDDSAKLTVSTARFVHNFSVGILLDGPDWCRDAAKHGVDALLDSHRQDDGAYPWLLSNCDVADPHRTCYAHAFVLFALSTATMAGIPRAAGHVAETFDSIHRHFWEDEHDLCRGKLDAEWNETESYRGQNANMHVCEALIGAYEATGDDRYIDRATSIAERLALELTDEGDGLLWEHYTTDWTHDWGYHRDVPRHLFRPWGYQPGHLVEWTKLLHLDDHTDADWAWYIRIWTYAWNQLINHDHGNWYFKLTRDNQLHDDIDPTPEVKVGYHPIGACSDVLQTLDRTSERRSRSE